MFKNVVATDTSSKQLQFAPKLPNVKYHLTPHNLSLHQIHQNIGPKSTVDLVTIAQALHWFDPPKFYEQVKYVLKKPNGVIAAWCYTTPLVDSNVDSVFEQFYRVNLGPFWEEERKFVESMYTELDFPFKPVSKSDHTGPYEFEARKMMGLEDFVTYIRSLSAYINAKENGVELLSNQVLKEFKHAWNYGNGTNVNGGSHEKLVKFPIYLRIGKVGN